MIRTFSLVIPARVFTLFITEIALLFACYLAATFMDPDVGDPDFFLRHDSGLLRIGIVISFVIFGLFFRNLYASVRIRNRLDLFQSLCMIFGAAFIGQGLISYLEPGWLAPRKVMLVGSLLAFATLYGWRLLFNAAARSAMAARRVLFLGLSPTVVKLATHFDAHPEIGVVAIGFLEIGKSSPAPASLPRLGSMEDLEKILDEYETNSIIIGKREDIKSSWVGEFLALRFGGVQIDEASALYERIFVRKCVTELWPSRLVFAGALEPNLASLGLRSMFSPALAFAALLFTSPFILVAAGLIRLSSHGPIIEREPRIGLHDAPFDMYKFRCRQKDGNYTAAGKILTRLHLDLLPRLFNLLRGQMAIVGPRPEHPLYSARLSHEILFYRQRHRVKPGLTGWAGVHGIDKDHDTLRELEYDLYYVENSSPFLDSLILLLALKGVWVSSDSHAAESI